MYLGTFFLKRKAANFLKAHQSEQSFPQDSQNNGTKSVFCFIKMKKDNNLLMQIIYELKDILCRLAAVQQGLDLGGSHNDLIMQIRSRG